jgi:transcriptional regulator with XRE-family HTH domain
MEGAVLRDVVARNIRALAKQRGMALNAVADVSGVSRSQLFNVLNAESSPSLDWMARVARALEVEPWRLLVPVEGEARPRRKR